MAERGRHKVLAGHTWRRRARALLVQMAELRAVA
ncbi:hypothetical protein [Endothiovibrio diazotrophicus]